MNTAQLSKWLRKTPQPATVVIDGAKRIDVGTRGGRWAEVARTIEAMGWSKLEALDGQGNIIRATICEDDSDEKEDSKSQPAACCPTCGASLSQFAQLLLQAFQEGSKSQANAYQTIFAENTNLVGLLAQRLGTMEGAWQKQLQQTGRLVMDVAQARAELMTASTGNGDSDDASIGGLIKAFASGAAQAGQEPEPPKPNGRKGARS